MIKMKREKNQLKKLIQSKKLRKNWMPYAVSLGAFISCFKDPCSKEITLQMSSVQPHGILLLIFFFNFRLTFLIFSFSISGNQMGNSANTNEIKMRCEMVNIINHSQSFKLKTNKLQFFPINFSLRGVLSIWLSFGYFFGTKTVFAQNLSAERRRIGNYR